MLLSTCPSPSAGGLPNATLPLPVTLTPTPTPTSTPTPAADSTSALTDPDARAILMFLPFCLLRGACHVLGRIPTLAEALQLAREATSTTGNPVGISVHTVEPGYHQACTHMPSPLLPEPADPTPVH